MAQSFNSAVHYVRNGVSIPAIVLKSQMITETISQPKKMDPGFTVEKTTERLTLLFADPDKVGLVLAGKASAVASTQFDVKPLEPGMTNGWLEFGPVPTEIKDPIADHVAAVEADNLVKSQGGLVEDPTTIVTEAHKGTLPSKPFEDLTPEERAAVIYPYGNIITESGKTQEQLDADIAKQRSEQ